MHPTRWNAWNCISTAACNVRWTSGARITTRAGTAVVDSGVILDTFNYVVIDRTNTSGTFSLADDSDCIRLAIPPDTWNEQSVTYPGNPNRSAGCSWRPPAGLSCCLYTWVEYWPPGFDWVDVSTWYVDSTPTFGLPNDDYEGGISGAVYDNNGHRLSGAGVSISSAHGTASMLSAVQYYWPAGYFEEVPTGPGVFFVSAEKSGFLPGCYPDSVRLNTNERRSDINIYLYPVGLADQAVAAGRARPGSFWYADRLCVISERAGPARLTMVDELGRTVWNRAVELSTGVNRFSLDRRPSPGIYFVRQASSVSKIIVAR